MSGFEALAATAYLAGVSEKLGGTPEATPAFWAIVSAIAAAMSCLAALAANHFRAKQVRAAEAHSRVSAGGLVAGPFAFITQEYLDRRFRTTSPPLIDGETIYELRLAKARALKAFRKNDKDAREPWYKNTPSRDAWRRATQIAAAGYPNQIAFELSIALERLGIAVFTGTVKAPLLLALAADQILEDWLACEAWIDSYRSTNRELKHHSGRVPFHRRHAEWLVLVSALWMNREFPDYPPLKAVIDDFGGIQHVQDRFRHFSLADGDLLPSEGRAELSKLAGVEI